MTRPVLYRVKIHVFLYLNIYGMLCSSSYREPVGCASFGSTRNPLAVLKKAPFRQGQGGGAEGITTELRVMASGKCITECRMSLPEGKEQAWNVVL